MSDFDAMSDANMKRVSSAVFGEAEELETTTSTMRVLDGSSLVGKAKVKTGDAGSTTAKCSNKWFVAIGLGLLGFFFVFHPDPIIRDRIRSSVLAPVYPSHVNPDGGFLAALAERGIYVDVLLFSCACIGAVGLLDVGVARWFGPARYFALHVIVNGITVWFAYQDTLDTFFIKHPKSPLDQNTCCTEGTKCANRMAIALSIGLHSWHMLAYKLAPIDLVHHVPTQVVCILGIFLPWGPALNVNSMIFMGLPGGIDYALLIAWHGMAWHGMAWPGLAWPGLA